MKARALLGGIILTGAIISTATAALGASNKRVKQAKQSQLIQKIQSSSVSYTGTESKIIPIEINKACQSTLDSLTLKANYEKVYIQTINSLKKAIAHND